MGFFVFDAISRVLRRRSRAQRLQAAGSWPMVKAKLLASKLVMKDDLAEGAGVQDTQVEIPFYFGIADGFFGGHVRSAACSDSEGRRIQRALEEGMPLNVRYNPANPDETCVLATDNQGDAALYSLAGVANYRGQRYQLVRSAVRALGSFS